MYVCVRCFNIPLQHSAILLEYSRKRTKCNTLGILEREREQKTITKCLNFTKQKIQSFTFHTITSFQNSITLWTSNMTMSTSKRETTKSTFHPALCFCTAINKFQHKKHIYISTHRISTWHQINIYTFENNQVTMTTAYQRELTEKDKYTQTRQYKACLLTSIFIQGNASNSFLFIIKVKCSKDTFAHLFTI